MSTKEQRVVERWAEFSLTPQKEETIRDYFLTPYLHRFICCSYLCKNSVLSCEFIEEMMALSTMSFTHENYNKENLQKAITFLAATPDLRKRKKVLAKWKEEYPEDEFIQNFIPNDRMDWFSINKHQNMEPWFEEKYAEHFRYSSSMSAKTEMRTLLSLSKPD